MHTACVVGMFVVFLKSIDMACSLDEFRNNFELFMSGAAAHREEEAPARSALLSDTEEESDDLYVPFCIFHKYAALWDIGLANPTLLIV